MPLICRRYVILVTVDLEVVVLILTVVVPLNFLVVPSLVVKLKMSVWLMLALKRLARKVLWRCSLLTCQCQATTFQGLNKNQTKPHDFKVWCQTAKDKQKQFTIYC